MRKIEKILRKMVIIFTLLFLGEVYCNFTVATATENIIPPQEVRVTRQSSHTLCVKWKQTGSASGYVIYRKNPGKKRYKRVKTVTKGKTVK